MARGLPFAAVEELFKAAFVEAARRAQPRVGRRAHRQPRRHRHRADAARGDAPASMPARSRRPAAGPAVAGDPGVHPLARRPGPARPARPPRALPRQGPAPSFEALARSVTQDVHPRSLLDELCRLGLAARTATRCGCCATASSPARDSERAFAFLGSNVGDHLRAGVANVLAEAPPHVEQAVFADELSAESIAAFREIAKAQWQALLAATRAGAAGAGRCRRRRPTGRATGACGSASTPTTTR